MTRRKRSKRAAEAQAERALALGAPASVVPDGVIDIPDDFAAGSGTGSDGGAAAAAGAQAERRAGRVEAELRVHNARAALSARLDSGSNRLVAPAQTLAEGIVPAASAPPATLAQIEALLASDVAEMAALSSADAAEGDDDAADVLPDEARDPGPAPVHRAARPQAPAWAQAVAPRDSDQRAPRAPTEKTMSNGQAQKRTYLEGPPMSELSELAKTFPRVALKIHRYDARGGMATIYAKALFTPAEIATMESWLMMQCGGGVYPIIVTDPNDPLREICSSFAVKVEGAVRTPSPLDENHRDPNEEQYPPEWDAARDRGAHGAPGGSYRGPSFDRGHGGYPNPGRQPGYGERPAPGATMASDAVLLREVETLRGERVRAEQEAKRQAAAADLRVQALERELAAQRETAREERHKAELQSIANENKAAMQRLSDQIALANKPRDESGGSMKLVEILAPLLLTYLTTSGSSQSKLLEAMLLGKRDSDPFADLARIEPLITKLAGNRGNKDESALIQKMSEGQIQNVMLMAELVKSFAEEKLPEDSPGMKILQQVIGSAAVMGETWFKQKAEEAEAEANAKQLIAQRERTRALEAEAAVKRAREPVQSSTPAPAASKPNAQPQPAANGNSNGNLPPELAAQMAMLPASFQTPEWKKLLTELHLETNGKPTHEADEMGNYVVHYLEHLVMFGALPQELAGMLTNPQLTIDTVFALLPLSRKHPAYAKTVAAVVARAFTRHAAADAPAPAPAPTAQPSTVLVTPPASVNGSGHEDEEEEDEEEERVYPS